MTKLITQDQKAKIAERLIHGESPISISNNLNITVNDVLLILGDGDFSARLYDLFKTQAKGLALIAHHNITRIAFDDKASAATQLKASKILVDIARELEELSPNDLEPAHMSQGQLKERLEALQKEAIARAKPIDTGVIDMQSSADIDDMLE